MSDYVVCFIICSREVNNLTYNNAQNKVKNCSMAI